jgi:hypothetical protein
VCAGIVGVLPMTGARALADDAADVRRQIELLQQQNALLLEQVRQQQTVIEKLNQRVAHIEQTSDQRSRELDDLKSNVKDAAPASNKSGGFNIGKINFSGEGGVGYFHSQSEGAFPNAEFRLDEAKLFVEAPVWGDVYFFTELNLATRESGDLDLRVGELYLDFEDVSKLWARDRQLNVRIGRFDIPFGEEYLARDAIDNPLISHSLVDLWGVDEGIELYGSLGKFSYVAAVQNGGFSGTRDFNADKSVVGRLSYDPTRWLHLSASAMRTGDLDAQNDYSSELWFGGGWFRSIGSPDTTVFHANLLQGDVALQFSRGHLKAFGGIAQYDDNDPNGNNRRDIYYYSVEGVVDVTRKLYAAARFGQIFANQGYPLPGNANMDKYYFDPFGPQAEKLWRLSLGLGYQFNRHLLVKAEYSFEQGKEVGGNGRNHVNLFAAEAAFAF